MRLLPVFRLILSYVSSVARLFGTYSAVVPNQGPVALRCREVVLGCHQILDSLSISGIPVDCYQKSVSRVPLSM